MKLCDRCSTESPSLLRCCTTQTMANQNHLMRSLFDTKYAHKITHINCQLNGKNWMTFLNYARTAQFQGGFIIFIQVVFVLEKRLYLKLNYSCWMLRLELEMKFNFVLHYVTLYNFLYYLYNLFFEKKSIFNL